MLVESYEAFIRKYNAFLEDYRPYIARQRFFSSDPQGCGCELHPPCILLIPRGEVIYP
jgi:hypothetical protein